MSRSSFDVLEDGRWRHGTRSSAISAKWTEVRRGAEDESDVVMEGISMGDSCCGVTGVVGGGGRMGLQTRRGMLRVRERVLAAIPEPVLGS